MVQLLFIHAQLHISIDLCQCIDCNIPLSIGNSQGMRRKGHRINRDRLNTVHSVDLQCNLQGGLFHHCMVVVVDQGSAQLAGKGSLCNTLQCWEQFKKRKETATESIELVKHNACKVQSWLFHHMVVVVVSWEVLSSKGREVDEIPQRGVSTLPCLRHTCTVCIAMLFLLLFQPQKGIFCISPLVAVLHCFDGMCATSPLSSMPPPS